MTSRSPRLAGALVVLCLFWFGVALYFHRSYISKLRRENVPEIFAEDASPVPRSLLRKVGYFRTDKKSSFVNFPKAKADGTRRICSFGDSFAYGHEVGSAYDYPTLLQRRLERRGGPRAEVLNFGQPNFGFHQTFMAWDALGSEYECDVILIGPATFFPMRDTSFNHDDSNPYYLHARYVLEAGSVRLVEVVGETVEERFEEYHRLVPRLRYLRYDRRPPAILRAFLGKGRTIANPLYYRGDSIRAEAHETYRILLEQLSSRSSQVLVATGLDVAAAVSALVGPKLRVFTPVWPLSFPYRAPNNHFGPMGNDLIAQDFLRHLLKTDEGLWVLRSEPLPLRGGHFSEEAAPPLFSFEDIHVELSGVAVGNFVLEKARRKRRGSPGILRSQRVASLVLAGPVERPTPVTRSSGALEECFLQLSRPLRDGTPIWLEVGDRRERIGEIRLLDPDVAIGQMALDQPTGSEPWSLDQRAGQHRVVLRGGGARKLGASSDRLALQVGDEDIFSGMGGRMPITLTPSKPCWVVRANESGFVSVDELPASGVFDLALRDRRGVRRVPIARWSKVELR